jgi:hypothetical protein
MPVPAQHDGTPLHISRHATQYQHQQFRGGMVVGVSRIGHRDYLTSTPLSSICGGILNVLFMDAT